MWGVYYVLCTIITDWTYCILLLLNDKGKGAKVNCDPVWVDIYIYI